MKRIRSLSLVALRLLRPHRRRLLLITTHFSLGALCSSQQPPLVRSRNLHRLFTIDTSQNTFTDQPRTLHIIFFTNVNVYAPMTADFKNIMYMQGTVGTFQSKVKILSKMADRVKPKTCCRVRVTGLRLRGIPFRSFRGIDFLYFSDTNT